MKLKNILLVVKDIERSKSFYKDIFGLSVIRDFGENVILTEGLVLQEQKVWQQAVGKEIQTPNHAFELYFEEQDLDAFVARIQESSWDIEIISQFPETEQTAETELVQEEGQTPDLVRMPGEVQELPAAPANRFIRFYDPDGHVIEVGESVHRD